MFFVCCCLCHDVEMFTIDETVQSLHVKSGSLIFQHMQLWHTSGHMFRCLHVIYVVKFCCCSVFRCCLFIVYLLIVIEACVTMQTLLIKPQQADVNIMCSVAPSVCLGSNASIQLMIFTVVPSSPLVACMQDFQRKHVP